MAFLLATALILVAIASATENDLSSTANLNNQRSLEYAVDGAVTLAVQNVRFSGNPYGGPVSPYYNAAPATTDCLPNGAPGEGPPPQMPYQFVSIDGVQVSVFCIAQNDDALSSLTRVILFYGCPTASISAQNPCATQTSNGAPYSSVVLVARVTFDDYAINNTISCTPGISTSTCGAAMTINSWVLQTANN